MEGGGGKVGTGGVDDAGEMWIRSWRMVIMVIWLWFNLDSADEKAGNCN